MFSDRYTFSFFSIAPGFLITIFTIVLVDSLYYGDLTLKKIWLLTMSWDDWKCTPFNFIMYNVVPGNLDQHGTHPHWLHALVNLQMLYGPMGIVALYTSINFIGKKHHEFAKFRNILFVRKEQKFREKVMDRLYYTHHN